jgi:hypothetical protein
MRAKPRQLPASHEPTFLAIPQWEKELRLLFSLPHVFMPVMAPPTGVIDTRGRVDPGPDDRPGDRRSSRFLDPAAFRIHPYVREKYLAPLIASWIVQQPPPHEPGRSSRVYPAQFISSEKFLAEGLLVWPYKGARDVIVQVAETIWGQLQDWRAHPDGLEQTLPHTKPRHLPRFLRTELARLADLGIDVPQLYGTIHYSGTAMLHALSFYRELEQRRHALRATLRQDRQSLRSHLRYWRLRLRPDAFERIEIETKEILDSLERIRHPTDDAVRAYRRQLGIYRRGTDAAKQGFWTPLIGWAIRHLKGPSKREIANLGQYLDQLQTNKGPGIAHVPEPGGLTREEARQFFTLLKAGLSTDQIIVRFEERGLAEKEACAAVARILHHTWPDVHTGNPAVVKARYYNSL